MRIALTSTGRDLQARPSPSFGRCPTLLLVDTETDEVSAVDNPAVDAQSGAGVLAAQLVVDRGARALLTGRVGPRAMKVLAAAGVRVCDFGDLDARAALDRFRADELPEITTAAPPLGGRGGRSGRAGRGGGGRGGGGVGRRGTDGG